MASTRYRIAGVLVVFLVVLAGCTGGGGDAVSVGGDGGRGGGGAAGGGSFYADGERIVVREAYMRVEVESFDAAFDEARRIASDHGGFVAGWDHEIERGWHRGQLTIRVPAAEFNAARDDLAGLGRLEFENVEALDFTTEYEDREEHIADLRSEKRELERLLNRTDDVEQARRLRGDISELRNRIRELEREQSSVERREALSTIRVEIHEPESARPPRNYRSAFGIDDAFIDAFYGGLTAIKYVIVFFGYAIPVGFAAVILGGFALVWFRLFQGLRARVDPVLAGVGRGDRDGGDPGRTEPGAEDGAGPADGEDDPDG